MILADTSVWIEFLNATQSDHHVTLRSLIEDGEDICLTDIILTEILAGIKSDKEIKSIKSSLLNFPIYKLKNLDSYIQAADIYRLCRKKGLTVRKLIDCFIAQVAIENNFQLFHNDDDFNKIAKVIRNLQIYNHP